MRLSLNPASMIAVLVASAGLATGPASAQPASPEQEALKTAPDRIGPRLEVTPAGYDFGQIDDSKPVTRSITLTNTGDETLRIPEEGGLKGSCGCTVPQLEKFTLEPGESMQIEVTFDPRNRSGKQSKTVTIQTNSDRGPTIIPVEAMVIQRVQFVEGVANLGRVDQGDAATTTIRVRGTDTEFKVTGVELSRPDAYSATIVSQGFSERDDLVEGSMVEVGETTIEITLLADAPVGRVDSILKVMTNAALVPEHQTQVITQVAGDVRLDKPAMQLGALNAGDTFEQTLNLHSNKGNPFNIERIVFVSSDLSVEDRQLITVEHTPLAEETGLVGYAVTLKGDVTETMRLIRGRLVIVTDAPGQKVVTANVAGVVRPQRP